MENQNQQIENLRVYRAISQAGKLDSFCVGMNEDRLLGFLGPPDFRTSILSVNNVAGPGGILVPVEPDDAQGLPEHLTKVELTAFLGTLNATREEIRAFLIDKLKFTRMGIDHHVTRLDFSREVLLYVKNRRWCILL